MENGFSFELYEETFCNCFIYSSKYANGNLQLSLFGFDYKVNQIAHFADITLNQNKIVLAENEIIVDCKYKPTLVPQLKELGILKEQVGVYIANNMFYPIYTIDNEKIKDNSYVASRLIAA